MKQVRGITAMLSRVLMAMFIVGFIIAIPVNYTYYKYRVEVIKGETSWDIPTHNLNPLRK